MSIAARPKTARFVTALIVPLLASVAAADRVQAQAFLGAPPSRPFTVPGSEPALPPLALPRESEAPQPAREAEAAPTSQLVRLPARDQGWRIEGEGGRLDWPVYLPRGSLSGVRVRVAYRTDISVLPAASPVSVRINGVVVGVAREPAANGRIAEFDIPDRLLVPGHNAISIETQQRHRVDCSLDATYELWTAVDPDRTGLVFAGGAPAIATMADLPALPVDRYGALRIRLVTSAKLGPRDVERSLRAAQAIAIASRTAFPLVDFGPPLEQGVNLVLDIGSGAVEPDLQPSRRGRPTAGFAIEASQTASAVTLTLSAASDSELDATLAALIERATPQGSVEGRRLADGAKPFETTRNQSLADLGLETPTFGRRTTVTVPVNLPNDMLAADYDRAVLRLSGALTLGPETRASVIVAANGREVANWSLPRRAGAFDRHSLMLPLSALRPGPNRLEITTLLEQPRGSCQSLGAEESRLSISADSDIAMPRLARIGRFPDLAQFGAGLNLTAGSRPLRLVVPQPDRDSMAAAGTLVARLAMSGGRLIPVRFTADGLPEAGDDVLIVGPVDAFRPTLLETAGLDPAAMASVWTPAMLPKDGPERGKPAPDGSAPDADDFVCETQQRRRATTSDRRGASGVDTVAPSKGFGTIVETIVGGAGWATERARRLVSRRADLSEPKPGDIGLLAQGLSPNGARLTVMSGPDRRSLRMAAACLVAPRTWSGLAGRASFVTAGGLTPRTVGEASPSLFATQPANALNLRLIGAGWLSSNPLACSALALALVLAMTFGTASLLTHVGRKQP